MENANPETHGPNVVLPRLLRLDVSGYVLSCITDAPLLQDLWVSCTATATRALTSFVLRSSCHLRKLVIHECANPRALVAVLRAVPTLTAFFVAFSRRASGFIDEEHFFDALKMIVAGAEICPNLTHIAAGGQPGLFPRYGPDPPPRAMRLPESRIRWRGSRGLRARVWTWRCISGCDCLRIIIWAWGGRELSWCIFHGISSPNLDWLDFQRG
jgi:hypothetical protein